jgi:hypothetical protein
MSGMKKATRNNRPLLKAIFTLADAFTLHAAKCEQCSACKKYLDSDQSSFWRLRRGIREGKITPACDWGDDILETIVELCTPLSVPEKFSAEERRKYRVALREVQLKTAKTIGLTPRTIAKYHREDLEYFTAHAHELAAQISARTQ